MTKRTQHSDAREHRKQARAHKVGTDKFDCAAGCGESDWRVMQEHHLGARKHNDFIVLLCANDHCRVTDDQKDHPKVLPGGDEFLARVGKFLKGLVDLLRIILEHLNDFANELIARANLSAANPVGRK
jgi:hypothetical protein